MSRLSRGCHCLSQTTKEFHHPHTLDSQSTSTSFPVHRLCRVTLRFECCHFVLPISLRGSLFSEAIGLRFCVCLAALWLPRPSPLPHPS